AKHFGVAHFDHEFEIVLRATKQHTFFLTRCGEHLHFRSATSPYGPGGDAARPISGNFRFRAVCVEQARCNAALLIESHKFHPIGSDAAVPIAEPARETCRIVAHVDGFDNQKVVAASLSLEKWNRSRAHSSPALLNVVTLSN